MRYDVATVAAHDQGSDSFWCASLLCAIGWASVVDRGHSAEGRPVSLASAARLVVSCPSVFEKTRRHSRVFDDVLRATGMLEASPQMIVGVGGCMVGLTVGVRCLSMFEA